jgi:hypothetical protein
VNIIKIYNLDNKVYKLTIPFQSYLQYKNMPHPDDNVGRMKQYSTVSEPALDHVLESLLQIPTKSPEKDAQKILDFVHNFIFNPDVDPYIKAPLETIVEGGGDCDDLSTLAYTLMKKRGLDVIYIKAPPRKGRKIGHVFVGVAGDFKGKYIMYKGKKYFTAETTGTRWPQKPATWKIGQLSKKTWKQRKKFRLFK